ncbi:AAC(3) family N-acetyltransferase [Paramyrothecium foliicola]|nr:AAC(3) family N-acetyltransferase [Paramyrothecium foliicola]
MDSSQSKDLPSTKDSLVRELRTLGVTSGMTLLAHSSLRAVGFVVGGPAAVELALEEAIGADGTLVMPTFNGDLTDPQHWCQPAVSPEWWETIRHEAPAFDPAWTPSREMGALAECFRTKPGTLRSSHPHVSFAARGRYAEQITADSPLENGMGEGSPLSRISDLEGYVLLMGVSYDKNTSLHLSESRATFSSKKTQTQGAAVSRDGKTQWVEFQDLDWVADDFSIITEAFVNETGLARSGKLGKADALLLPQRQLVDFGKTWMEQYRR